jgi:hypothetical protein
MLIRPTGRLSIPKSNPPAKESRCSMEKGVERNGDGEVNKQKAQMFVGLTVVRPGFGSKK